MKIGAPQEVGGKVQPAPATACLVIARRLKSLELKEKVMKKDVQEALESAVAGFEKRQQAEQERLRERERFETDWARIRTAVVPRWY